MRAPVAVASALVAASAVMFLSPAFAVEAWQYREDGVGVSDHVPGAPGGPGRGGAGPQGGGGGGGGARLYPYWTIGWDGDRFCRQVRYTTDPDLAAAYNFAYHRQFAGGNAPGNADPCPAGTATAPPGAVLPTPDQLARDFWTVRVLPAPTLRMSPDYAVTGKPIYLQIGGERQKRFDVPNPIGPAITIETTSRYVVDWGDGTVETTTSQGGPWPDGDVTHVYTTSTRARTIRVSQQWSATWSAGDQGGALDALRTDGSLTFRVEQVQAVRG